MAARPGHLPPERDHQLEIALGRVGALAVRLVHGEDVGALEDTRLDRLHVVAEPGRHHDQRGVRHAGDLQLVLPDADRLDDDDVGAPCVEHVHDVGGRAGEAAERAARRQRADEDVRVRRVALHPDAVAEDGAAREGARGVDGDDGDPLAPLA